MRRSFVNLRYSRHARRRMTLRDINEDMVEGILLEPEFMPPTSRGTRYDGFVAGRRVAVVVDERDDPATVVTIFWADEGDGDDEF